MISNAKNNLIGASTGLPNMSQTITGWFQDITFGVVEKVVCDYETKVQITDVNTKGVVQPAGFQTLDILPEGERNWDIQEIHCLPDLKLKVGEFIMYKGTKYRVLKRENYAEYGYMHYVIREAFNNE